MTRDEIFDQYTIEGFTIRDPGKFEAEPAYAPYYYEFTMDGGCQILDFADGTRIDVVEVDDADRQVWPELNATTFAIAVEETDQGFVSVTEITEEVLARLTDESEASFNDQDGEE